MSDASNAPNESDKPVEMTASQAAALVFREVPELDDEGKPTGKTAKKSVRPDEVFAFRDYGTHVVVVTIDGRKLRGDKPKADAKSKKAAQ
ncbi:hypothetical protein ACR2R6_12920 [Methylocaldum gracile subsp. desertum]|uniref:hypothetical protein n=1 Tax=Methylocaldum sp. GT1BW TaxID=3438964 RepID=UPI003DA1348C